MHYRYQRSYRGPIQGVIFDWAGTTIDHGCVAPAVTFAEVFERHGVPISILEARGPMGTHKRRHIELLLEDDAIAKRWQAVHGKAPGEADIESLYQAFVPLQLETLAHYAKLIPGALENINALRARGCKIGSTTGYTVAMMAVNRPLAAAQGYVPDSVLCAEEMPAGRPFPHMCLQNAINLGISTVEACVKVDDTTTGIDAGLSAGMWTIGLACSGNEVGLSHEAWTALEPAEQARLRARAYDKHIRAGAHFVIDSIADIMPCIDEIEARLRRGEKP